MYLVHSNGCKPKTIVPDRNILFIIQQFDIGLIVIVIAGHYRICDRMSPRKTNED